MTRWRLQWREGSACRPLVLCGRQGSTDIGAWTGTGPGEAHPAGLTPPLEEGLTSGLVRPTFILRQPRRALPLDATSDGRHSLERASRAQAFKNRVRHGSLSFSGSAEIRTRTPSVSAPHLLANALRSDVDLAPGDS